MGMEGGTDKMLRNDQNQSVATRGGGSTSRCQLSPGCRWKRRASGFKFAWAVWIVSVKRDMNIQQLNHPEEEQEKEPVGGAARGSPM